MLYSHTAKGQRRTLPFVLLILCLLFFYPASAYAMDESQVEFEVKFLLNSDTVLTEDHLLVDEVLTLIGAEPEYKTISAIYLETDGRAFHQEGWINRIRWKENKKKIERTYKKRYPLSGEDAEAIRAALAQAEADGLPFSDTAFSAEIDWGYSQMTLSATMETSGKYKDYHSLSQFSTADAVDFLKKTMPKEELNWKGNQWGVSMLDQAKKIGPLQYWRVKGNWEGTEVQVEIYPIRDSYITELSFKAAGLESASALRAKMKALLEEKGVLLYEDSLKTQMILDNFLRKYP